MGELQSIGTWWMWSGFGVFVVAMLAIDMFALRRKGAHKVGAREALTWSLVWFALAMLFGGALWGWLDHTAGREVADARTMEYLTGYLLEKTLAMDNIFVFVMLFSYFAVPIEYQKRVLVYGVLGAIILRALMILLGAWLIAQFHWVLYIFGAFLLITGIKMFIFADHEPDLAKNPLLKWLRNHVRITDSYHGEKFWIYEKGVRWFTPMFLVLVLVEFSDVIFALDSIPAIFAITSDPFIVFTSNIFAILGLRSFYFALRGIMDIFYYLKYTLSVILIFIGVKMILNHHSEIVGSDFHISNATSLIVIASLLAISIVASILRSKHLKNKTHR